MRYNLSIFEMNGDNNGESQQKRSSIFLYFFYAIIFGLITLLLFQTFISGVSEVSINTLVTQNVEENLNCECKIFFDNGNSSIQTKTEDFTLKRYENKEFSYRILAKKKKVAIFEECYCDGRHHYEQSKAYIGEIVSDKISIDFAFVKNNTNISWVYRR